MAKEIEILPQFMLGDANWAVSGDALGFSAPYIYSLHHANDWSSVRTLEPQKQEETSFVALLATTEHITAANVRKDLIIAGVIDPQTELHNLDLLLGSPLFKHSKSPTLWFHRSWLLQRYPQLRDLDRELAIIAKAAAHHPRNYYAWAYARELESCRRVSDWVWSLCQKNLSDVSMWCFLAHVDVTKRAEAQQIMDQWPHESVAAYLKLTN